MADLGRLFRRAHLTHEAELLSLAKRPHRLRARFVLLHREATDTVHGHNRRRAI